MIKAIEKLTKAFANYNKTTGEGANELLLAYFAYQRKSREVNEALERV
jgi:hypothetical protein